MTTTVPSRINWIDYAKGICIVMVVMMHSTLGVGEALNGEGWLHWVVAWARPFRMPDFFLIAGLFLFRSISQSWLRFIDRKLVHFLYFYIVWMLVQLVIKQGYLVYSEPAIFFKELGLAFLEPYATLWFIYILPIMFVIAKLVVAVPKWLVLSIAVLAELLCRVFNWHTGWIILDELPVRFVYFYAGYIFAPTLFKWVSWVQKNQVLAVQGILVWALVNTAAVFTPATLLPSPVVPAHMPTAQPLEFGSLAFYPGFSLVFSTAGILAVLACAGLLAQKKYLQVLEYAGSHSIVIYLSFFIPMAVTRVLVVKLGIANVTIASLVVTLSAIAVPLVFYLLVGHNKLKFLYERPSSFRVA